MQLRLAAGYESMKFPNDERIHEDFRGKTLRVLYNKIGNSERDTAKVGNIELAGYAKDWVLSQVRERRP